MTADPAFFVVHLKDARIEVSEYDAQVFDKQCALWQFVERQKYVVTALYESVDHISALPAFRLLIVSPQTLNPDGVMRAAGAVVRILYKRQQRAGHKHLLS